MGSSSGLGGVGGSSGLGGSTLGGLGSGGGLGSFDGGFDSRLDNLLGSVNPTPPASSSMSSRGPDGRSNSTTSYDSWGAPPSAPNSNSGFGSGFLNSDMMSNSVSNVGVGSSVGSGVGFPSPHSSLSTTPVGSQDTSPAGRGGGNQDNGLTGALNRLDIEKRQQVENTVLSFLQ